MGQSQPQITAPAQMPELPPAGNKKNKIIIAAAALVVILAAGAYAAYAAYFSPERVWQKFTNGKVLDTVSSQIVSENFNFAYKDNGKITGKAAEDPGVSMIAGVNFSGKGTSYVNISKPSEPEMTVDMDYSAGASGVNFSGNVKLLVKGDDLYFNYGDNAFLQAGFAQLNEGKKVDWVKMNLRELNEVVSSTGTNPSNFNLAENTKEYQNIIQKYLPKVLLLDKYLGKEQVQGAATYHYSNKIDKAQAKEMVKEFSDKIVQQWVSQGLLKEDEAQKNGDILNKALGAFIDKSTINNLETWVGVKDGELYRVKYSFSAPSVASFISFLENQPEMLDGQDDPAAVVDTIMKNISFDGVFSGEREIFDAGKTKQITVPENPLDFVKAIKDSRQNTNQIPPEVIIK